MGNTNEAPILGRAACGQDVIHLQCALAGAGLFDNDIDGCFGPVTVSAMKAFERSQGLAETGTLTVETANRLGWRKAEPTTSRVPAVTAELVGRLFSTAARPHVGINLPHVMNALAEAGLADRTMVAMALATVRVETSLFLPISELASAFNTSPGGKPFDLYDRRAALGNQGAPDGSRFRGRGFIQLTGRSNYAQFGRALQLGAQLLTDPFLAHESATSARILAAYLKSRETRIRTELNASRLADARRAVNGGTNGLADFTTAYELALQLLPERLPPAA